MLNRPWGHRRGTGATATATATAPRQDIDLIRSAALSSAELWQEILQRLSDVQESQIILAQSIEELGSIMRDAVTHLTPSLAPATSTADALGQSAEPQGTDPRATLPVGESAAPETLRDWAGSAANNLEDTGRPLGFHVTPADVIGPVGAHAERDEHSVRIGDLLDSLLPSPPLPPPPHLPPPPVLPPPPPPGTYQLDGSVPFDISAFMAPASTGPIGPSTAPIAVPEPPWTPLPGAYSGVALDQYLSSSATRPSPSGPAGDSRWAEPAPAAVATMVEEVLDASTQSPASGATTSDRPGRPVSEDVTIVARGLRRRFRLR